MVGKTHIPFLGIAASWNGHEVLLGADIYACGTQVHVAKFWEESAAVRRA